MRLAVYIMLTAGIMRVRGFMANGVIRRHDAGTIGILMRVKDGRRDANVDLLLRRMNLAESTLPAAAIGVVFTYDAVGPQPLAVGAALLAAKTNAQQGTSGDQCRNAASTS